MAFIKPAHSLAQRSPQCLLVFVPYRFRMNVYRDLKAVGTHSQKIDSTLRENNYFIMMLENSMIMFFSKGSLESEQPERSFKVPFLKQFHFILKDHSKERPSFNTLKDLQRIQFDNFLFGYPPQVIFQVWLHMLDRDELC